MLNKGIFTISIDTELAWGTFDNNGHVKYKEAYKNYRYIIGELLKLFEKYEVSATWAVVGHLFLDKCEKINGKTHPDIVRPNHRWFKGDWLKFDPGSDISNDSFWYGKDIIDMIKGSVTIQEIACHSFSHPIFSDKDCSKEAAESDIKKCVELAKNEQIKLKSFVFPRNTLGHLDVLSNNGFKIYRGDNANFSKVKPESLKRMLVLLSDMLAFVAPPVVLPRPTKHKGLFELEGSFQFRYAYGKSRLIGKRVRSIKAKKGIDAAIRNNKVFHMWFHPISFAWKTREMLSELESILEYATKKKKENVLEILTLQDIAHKFSQETNSPKDNFNQQSIVLHNERSSCFKQDYSLELSDYYKNAFKYGRKKMEETFFNFLDGMDKGSRILDIGSGTGYYLNIMHERSFDCLGVDLSENMIKQLRRSYPHLRVQLADARRLPFPDNYFDGVISIETLRYFSDRDALIKEVARVLRPSGKTYITAAPFFSLNTYGFINSACKLLCLRRFVSCFQTFETVGSLRRLFNRGGFKEINVNGFFFGPYFLLDKIHPKSSAFMMRKLEGLDDRLSRLKALRNFSNHLVVVAQKKD